MKKRILCAALAAAVTALSLTACGTAENGSGTGAEKDKGSGSEITEASQAQSDTEPVTAAAQPPENSANAINSFSTELFRRCCEEKKGSNVMISPLSVYMALGMLSNAASGDTAEELTNALSGYVKVMDAEVDYASHDPFTVEEINASMRAYLDGTSKDDILNIANSIFVMEQKGITLSDSFRSGITDMYDAEVFFEPFSTSTVDNVNSWVNDKTKQMIPKILNPDDINDDTVAILLNAIAFEGTWTEEFKESQVYDEEFTNYDGSRTTSEFLHGTEEYYISDDYATGFIKPYETGEDGNVYSFVAILPNEDVSVDDYIKWMDADTVTSLVEGKKEADVRIEMPKFSFDDGYSLKEHLSGMGLPVIFTESADFSKLASNGKDDVYVNDVIHKTHIEVDEKGTKAAAATAITKQDNAAVMVEEFYEVVLNRPFVFAIYDHTENIPVFIGTVCNI